MSYYSITTAPASEPITLTTAKLWLKVDYSTDDALITELIQAAREQAEKYLAIGLLPQTVTETFDCFPSTSTTNTKASIPLSLAPLRAITSINYTDTNGDSQTLATSVYKTIPGQKPPHIFLRKDQSWPDTLDEVGAITVVYTIGYDDADSVPSDIKTAMRLMISHLYDNRNDSVRRYPVQSEYILDKTRVY